ncbi:SLATT domain-containing protein, partial [Streptomyces sp. SID2999]
MSGRKDPRSVFTSSREGRVDQPDTQAGSPSGDPAGRTLPPGDWAEPAERLDELYRWVEQGALRTADRYLADRRRR